MSNTLITNKLARPGVPNRRRQGSKVPLEGKKSRTSRDGQQGYANLMLLKEVLKDIGAALTPTNPPR